MDGEPQLDGEYVFRDVVHIISQYADAKSLNNMTAVSRSWRFAAIREKRNRKHLIQQLNGSLHNLSALPKALKGTPSVSLFFYKKVFPRLRATRENAEQEDLVRYLREHIILTRYQELLPNLAITVRVDRFFAMEKGRIIPVKQRSGSRCPTDRDIQGLFFPNLDPSQVTYHTTMIMPVDFMSETDEDAVVRLTEELGFNDVNCKHPKSTLLLFSFFGRPKFCGAINELLKRQAKKRKEITFAGFYGTKIRATEDNRPCVCCGDMRMLLRISGPRIESWSTFIRFDARLDGIHRKLTELKKRVKSKRNFIGLVFAPSCTVSGCRHYDHPCMYSVLFMKIITREFPYIRFRGFFVYDSDTAKNPLTVIQYFRECSYERQGSTMHASIVIIGHD